MLSLSYTNGISLGCVSHDTRQMHTATAADKTDFFLILEFVIWLLKNRQFFIKTELRFKHFRY